MKTILLPLLIMTAMITGPLVASAQSKTENIFYYFPNIKGYQSLEKNYRDIDILAPQIYTVGYDLKLGKAQSEDVLKFAKKKRMDVMPLVIQSGFDKALMTGILNDHNAQDQIIKDLIDEAKKGIYRLAI